jgi:hypothetical protein
MTQYSDIIVTPVYGPLNSSQYPNSMPSHNLGILSGKIQNPPQFYPSQEPVYSDQNTIARQQYKRVTSKQWNSMNGLYTYNNVGQIMNSNKYIGPKDSSQVTARLKSVAVGKTVYNTGLSQNASTSTKNYFPSEVRSSLRRARSGGSSAPAKKTATYNTTSTSGQTYGLGSVIRSTYS